MAIQRIEAFHAPDKPDGGLSDRPADSPRFEAEPPGICRIIEVGPGSHPVLDHYIDLAKKYPSRTVEVFLIDLKPIELKFALNELPDNLTIKLIGNTDVRSVLAGGSNQLPEELKGKLDQVIIRNVFGQPPKAGEDHVGLHPDSLVKQIFEWLRPGGTIRIEEIYSPDQVYGGSAESLSAAFKSAGFAVKTFFDPESFLSGVSLGSDNFVLIVTKPENDDADRLDKPTPTGPNESGPSGDGGTAGEGGASTSGKGRESSEPSDSGPEPLYSAGSPHRDYSKTPEPKSNPELKSTGVYRVVEIGPQYTPVMNYYRQLAEADMGRTVEVVFIDIQTLPEIDKSILPNNLKIISIKADARDVFEEGHPNIPVDFRGRVAEVIMRNVLGQPVLFDSDHISLHLEEVARSIAGWLGPTGFIRIEETMPISVDLEKRQNLLVSIEKAGFIVETTHDLSRFLSPNIEPSTEDYVIIARRRTVLDEPQIPKDPRPTKGGASAGPQPSQAGDEAATDNPKDVVGPSGRIWSLEQNSNPGAQANLLGQVQVDTSKTGEPRIDLTALPVADVEVYWWQNQTAASAPDTVATISYGEEREILSRRAAFEALANLELPPELREAAVAYIARFNPRAAEALMNRLLPEEQAEALRLFYSFKPPVEEKPLTDRDKENVQVKFSESTLASLAELMRISARRARGEAIDPKILRDLAGHTLRLMSLDLRSGAITAVSSAITAGAPIMRALSYLAEYERTHFAAQVEAAKNVGVVMGLAGAGLVGVGALIFAAPVAIPLGLGVKMLELALSDPEGPNNSLGPFSEPTDRYIRNVEGYDDPQPDEYKERSFAARTAGFVGAVAASAAQGVARRLVAEPLERRRLEEAAQKVAKSTGRARVKAQNEYESLLNQAQGAGGWERGQTSKNFVKATYSIDSVIGQALVKNGGGVRAPAEVSNEVEYALGQARDVLGRMHDDRFGSPTADFQRDIQHLAGIAADLERRGMVKTAGQIKRVAEGYVRSREDFLRAEARRQRSQEQAAKRAERKEKEEARRTREAGARAKIQAERRALAREANQEKLKARAERLYGRKRQPVAVDHKNLKQAKGSNGGESNRQSPASQAAKNPRLSPAANSGTQTKLLKSKATVGKGGGNPFSVIPTPPKPNRGRVAIPLPGQSSGPSDSNSKLPLLPNQPTALSQNGPSQPRQPESDVPTGELIGIYSQPPPRQPRISPKLPPGDFQPADNYVYPVYSGRETTSKTSIALELPNLKGNVPYKEPEPQMPEPPKKYTPERFMEVLKAVYRMGEAITNARTGSDPDAERALGVATESINRIYARTGSPPNTDDPDVQRIESFVNKYQGRY